MQTTSNYGLKKPEANDAVNIADLNANADTLDSALTPTADPTQVPTGNGPGKLVQWVGWLANRIKAITGKTNWYDAPDITLATLAAHKTRHATGGADALAPADIGAAPSSHTHTRSQITDFAHKSTHASGGSDALIPADIGAAAAADLSAHLADTAPHGATSANTASRIVIRDASGNFSAGMITASLNGNASSATNADKVDNIHFRVNNGSLQYDDGTGWKDVGLITTVPRAADCSISTPTIGTLYTVANVTGKGRLHRVSGYSNAGIQNLNLVITIDGTSYSYTPSGSITTRTTSTISSNNAILFLDVAFFSSLKVEVAQVAGTVGFLAGSIDYSLA